MLLLGVLVVVLVAVLFWNKNWKGKASGVKEVLKKGNQKQTYTGAERPSKQAKNKEDGPQLCRSEAHTLHTIRRSSLLEQQVPRPRRAATAKVAQ